VVWLNTAPGTHCMASPIAQGCDGCRRIHHQPGWTPHQLRPRNGGGATAGNRPGGRPETCGNGGRPNHNRLRQLTSRIVDAANGNPQHFANIISSALGFWHAPTSHKVGPTSRVPRGRHPKYPSGCRVPSSDGRGIPFSLT
jgi:hypothetical protein